MKIVSAYQARTNFGEILNLVHYQGDEVVVERKGRPIAKIVKFITPKPKTEKVTQNLSTVIKTGSVVARLFGSLRSPFGYVPLAKVRAVAGEQLGKQYHSK